MKSFQFNLIVILIASLVTFFSGFGNLISIIEPLSFLKFEISDSYSRYVNFSSFENTYLINNEWWRLFAPVFIHFSLIHLVFNCLWVYVLGQQIEKIDGKILFITLIIFSGICGNYAQFISTGPSLFGGLSGCVYGMFGYTMITEFQKSRIIYGLPPAIYIFMIAWLVLGFIGVLSLFGLGNIANFAHLGGLIAGVIMAMVVTIISKDSYLDEKIKKAVLPVAGFGTRFLPATKAIPKEMLAIIDKPLIQYAVEEAVSAGAEEIIFITSYTKGAIENHFTSYPELEERLISSNKLELLEKIKPSYLDDLKFTYIHQEIQKGLGHAIYLAKDAIGNNPFSVLLPDDLFISSPSCLQQLAESFSMHGNSTIAVNVIDKENIHKYGVINKGDNEIVNNEIDIFDIVEKPSAEDAPSDIAACGRYVFNPSIFDLIEEVKPDSSGEIQITDAIRLLLKKENVKARLYEGEKYDCGSRTGYVEATIAVGMKDPEISDNIKKIIRESI